MWIVHGQQYLNGGVHEAGVSQVTETTQTRCCAAPVTVVPTIGWVWAASVITGGVSTSRGPDKTRETHEKWQQAEVQSCTFRNNISCWLLVATMSSRRTYLEDALVQESISNVLLWIALPALQQKRSQIINTRCVKLWMFPASGSSNRYPDSERHRIVYLQQGQTLLATLPTARLSNGNVSHQNQIERRPHRDNTHTLVCLGQVPSSFFFSMTMTWPWYSPASCTVLSGLFRCS